MTTIDGVEYHEVPSKLGCFAFGTACHFRGMMNCRETGRDSLCDTTRGAAREIIFITRETYIDRVVERLTK